MNELGFLAITCVGFALSAHLTVIWAMGESIGHRPLLILSVLLMVIGVQVLATGLIAELIVHLARNEHPFVIGRVVRAGRSEAPQLDRHAPTVQDAVQ